MSPIRHSTFGRVEAHVPACSEYISLQKWAESDAEFVRSLAVGGRSSAGNASRRLCPNPAVVDSYSCRQMYLRSYTFSRKETVPEKTVKCLGKLKEKTVDLLSVNLDRNDSDLTLTTVRFVRSPGKKKGRSLVLSTIRCLTSCAAGLDTRDAESVVHAL